jgi:hypothetical protein
VWPAVRSGNKTRWFHEHRSWLVDPLAVLRPDLVVLATGTNDEDDVEYETAITALARTARHHAPDADIAIWLPPVNRGFTRERAEIGREVADQEGCGVIDAAGDLGPLPTSDGVHPTPLTIGLGAAHAASVLGGPDTGAWWSAIVEANRALAHGQRWGGAGGGVIDVELLAGLATLSGKVRADDPAAAWVLALPPLAKVATGIDSALLGLGPGGTDLPDTFLSRLEPGRLAVNGGTGSIEVGRLAMRVDGAEPGTTETVTVHAARADDGGVELVAVGADGSPRRLAVAPSGLEVPLPCSLRAHHHPTVPLEPAADQVVWVPMPALAVAAVATTIWIEVRKPAVGARITAGLAGRGEPSRPGALLGTTGVGAIDAGTAGVVGAALVEPVRLEAGAIWWVALHVVDAGEPGLTLSGATTLRAGAAGLATQPGEPPTMDVVSGAVVTDRLAAIPTEPGRDVASLVGPAPALHVSLEVPRARPTP